MNLIPDIHPRYCNYKSNLHTALYKARTLLVEKIEEQRYIKKFKSIRLALSIR
jgi:hypothetical protein